MTCHEACHTCNNRNRETGKATSICESDIVFGEKKNQNANEH